MHGRVRLPGLMALLAMAAFGQDTTIHTAGPSGTGVHSVVPVFDGVPYSADQVVERMRTLADGTQVAEKVQESRMYRDSAGRTRVERPGGMRTVVIVDPIAHVSYWLDAEQKVAYMRVSHTPPRPLDVEGTAPTKRPQTAVEKLGDKTIEGVLVSGTRSTITLPARSGSDQPRVTVREVWGSRELHLMVLSETHDLLRGDTRQRMMHVSRAEPDARLFRVPAEFTIVDDDAVRQEAMRAASERAAPEPAVRAEEQSQPEPVAQAEAAPNDAPIADESPAEASFADAPVGDYAADGDGAGAYIEVNTVYVGVHGKAPVTNTSKAVVPSGAATAPAQPKQPNPKIPKKTPGTEKPAQ